MKILVLNGTYRPNGTVTELSRSFMAGAQAGGVLFASPVHNGFVTGLMTVFWECLSWRVARPGEPLLGCASIVSRINDKVRAGRLRPFTIDQVVHPALRWILEPIFGCSPPFKVARQ